MLLLAFLCYLLHDASAKPAKVTESSEKAIQMANLHLDAVYKTKLATINAQAASLKTLLTVIDAENTAAINKYTAGIKTIHSDLVGAVKRLDVFSRNVTLLALKESTSEAFTRAYYEMFNRNLTDRAAIDDGFQQLRTNVSNLLQTASDQYFSEAQRTAESLASVIRAGGTFSEKCNKAIGPKITGSFAPLQREFDACLARERRRLARISESVDRVVQLLRLNMAEFATDISSCTRFGSFATNYADYHQTKGCLEANILEMNRYKEMIHVELNQLQPTVQVETEANGLRIRHCVMQSAYEGSSLMEGTRTVINRCAEVGP